MSGSHRTYELLERKYVSTSLDSAGLTYSAQFKLRIVGLHRRRGRSVSMMRPNGKVRFSGDVEFKSEGRRHMHKFVLWILMICSFSAVAGVDERFASGAIGAEWGATLQEVQAAYPNGLSWPGIDKDLADTVVYEVAGDPRMLGTHTPIRLVQFSFSSENKLTRIDFHFSFSDRDNAVYDVAEMLGQDFSTTELPRGRRLT